MCAETLARAVKLLVLDVDGVLTDGGLYYDAQGNVSKRFNVQDGLGVKLLMAAGLRVAVVTGLNNSSVAARVRELGIDEYHPGYRRKAAVVRDIAARLGVGMHEVAFLGDDWVDADALGVVGLPMAVANAQPEILALAAWTSTASGGNGAVREAVRFILAAQGKLAPLWAEWRSE